MTTKLHLQDRAEYQRVHKWISTQLGKAAYCSADRNHIASRYHWSNVSHQYKYDVFDWQQLCPSCHKAFDGISPEFREIKRLQAMGNTNHARPVLQLFGSSSWLRHPSSRVASERTNADRTGIALTLSGRQKTAGGFRWKRVEEVVT